MTSMKFVKRTHVEEKKEWKSMLVSISNKLTPITLTALYRNST